ncbi:MAG: DUF4199 domain-containing protein [Bacteroidota bacterium]
MKPTAVNTGLIMGTTSVVFTVLCYILGPWAFGSMWLLLAMTIVSLTGFFYFAIQARKMNGGYFTYAEAYKFCIVVTAVWVPIMIFSKYLFILIDLPFFEQVNELMVEDQITRFEAFGMPEAQINVAVAEVEKSYAESLTPIGQVKALAWMFFGFAIVDLLFALFIRKKRPEFA